MVRVLLILLYESIVSNNIVYNRYLLKYKIVNFVCIYLIKSDTNCYNLVYKIDYYIILLIIIHNIIMKYCCFKTHKPSINEQLIIHERKKLPFRRRLELWVFFNTHPNTY